MIHFFIALWNTHTNTPQIIINTITKNCPIFWHLQLQQLNQAARWEIFMISKHLWSHVGVQWYCMTALMMLAEGQISCSTVQNSSCREKASPVNPYVVMSLPFLPFACGHPPAPLHILTVPSSSSHRSPHPLGSSQVCDIIKHMLFEVAVMTAVPTPPPTQ